MFAQLNSRTIQTAYFLVGAAALVLLVLWHPDECQRVLKFPDLIITIVAMIIVVIDGFFRQSASLVRWSVVGWLIAFWIVANSVYNQMHVVSFPYSDIPGEEAHFVLRKVVGMCGALLVYTLPVAAAGLCVPRRPNIGHWHAPVIMGVVWVDLVLIITMNRIVWPAFFGH